MIDGIKSILNLIVLSVIWRICYSIIITISMSNTFNSLLRVSLIAVLILCASADNYPIDVINGREYEGNFSAAQSGVFNLLGSNLSIISMEERED